MNSLSIYDHIIDIEDRHSLFATYRITEQGFLLGYLYSELDLEGNSIWRCTTTALVPLQDNIGSHIDVMLNE